MASIKIESESMDYLSAEEARWRLQVWFMMLTIRLLALIATKLGVIRVGQINNSVEPFIKTVDEIIESWNGSQEES